MVSDIIQLLTIIGLCLITGFFLAQADHNRLNWMSSDLQMTHAVVSFTQTRRESNSNCVCDVDESTPELAQPPDASIITWQTLRIMWRRMEEHTCGDDSWLRRINYRFGLSFQSLLGWLNVRWWVVVTRWVHRLDRNTGTLWSGVVTAISVVLVAVVLWPIAPIVVDVAIIEVTSSTIAENEFDG